MKKLVRLYIALALLLALAPQLIGPALAAWPLTRRTTYVANSTPVIKAADLNAMQDVVGEMLIGNLSYKGLVIDGTGGAAVTPPSGAVLVTKAASNTNLPNPTISSGEVTRGTVALGWARIDAAGALVRGVNVRSVSPIGPGFVTVEFNSQNVSSGSSCTVTAVSPRMTSCVTQTNAQTRLEAIVVVSNAALTPTATEFSVTVFGE